MSHRVTSRNLLARALYLASLLLGAAASTSAQDATLVKLWAQYITETNPVAKAKVLAKLGPRELTEVKNLFNSGDDDKAQNTLEHYRDSVRETTKALSATGIDASRHSGGFKELQISLRVFIRHLDDLVLSLQQDVRPSFRAVRTDLEVEENTLIDALFPARATSRAKTANAQ